jgi:hypothetical protein
MNETQSTLGTWWTVEGFSKAAKPEVFSTLPKTGVVDEILKAAGYKCGLRYGGEFDALQLEIYRHKIERHLLVYINNEDGGLAFFFVSLDDTAAFFATWYPQFLTNASLVAQRDKLERIATTLTAFVRHGHGLETIEEYGDRSQADEQQNSR